MCAPRPRERTEGSTFGGRGPTIASRGSESERGVGERRLALPEGLRSSFLRWARRGDRDRDRCLRFLSVRIECDDLEREREEEDRRRLRLWLDLYFLCDRLFSLSLSVSCRRRRSLSRWDSEGPDRRDDLSPLSSRFRLSRPWSLLLLRCLRSRESSDRPLCLCPFSCLSLRPLSSVRRLDGPGCGSSSSLRTGVKRPSALLSFLISSFFCARNLSRFMRFRRALDSSASLASNAEL